jgi:hypothetical protein
MRSFNRIVFSALLLLLVALTPVWAQPADSPRPTPRFSLALTSAAPDQLKVLARGQDTSLIERSKQGEVWSPWRSIGGSLSSAPAAVSWAPTRIDVVARAQGDRLVQAWSQGIWSDFVAFPLQGIPDSPPTICAWEPARLDVFALGTDRTLRHLFYWGRWSGWESLGGELSSAPAAVSWGKGRIDVVARGAGNSMQHRYYNGVGWSGWESLPFDAPPVGAPSICSWGVGRLDIFVRGTDGALWRQYYNGNWSRWESLGGQMASDPACLSPKMGRIDIVALDGNDHILHRWFEKEWSEFTTVDT